MSSLICLYIDRYADIVMLILLCGCCFYGYCYEDIAVRILLYVYCYTEIAILKRLYNQLDALSVDCVMEASNEDIDGCRHRARP